ncbi:MAG: SH3 domain-containing protein [Parvularculaceae bacterium]
MRILVSLLFMCSVAFASSGSAAAQPAPEARATPRLDTPSGLPVPRFVALKTARTNGRAGPSFDHPIIWRYEQKGLPVEVIAESGPWRRIRDPEGDEAWIHESMLAGSRQAMIRALDAPAAIWDAPDEAMRVVAFAERGVLLRLLACEGDWCRVRTEAGQAGWVKRQALWGVYADETIG